MYFKSKSFGLGGEWDYEVVAWRLAPADWLPLAASGRNKKLVWEYYCDKMVNVASHQIMSAVQQLDSRHWTHALHRHVPMLSVDTTIATYTILLATIFSKHECKHCTFPIWPRKMINENEIVFFLLGTIYWPLTVVFIGRTEAKCWLRWIHSVI